MICRIVVVSALLTLAGCWSFLPPRRTTYSDSRLSATSGMLDWSGLRNVNLASPSGKMIEAEFTSRREGRGTAHTDNEIRLFDLPAGTQPRVTFYKDRASWCPYCQKVWILLEEKRIPYKVEKINMRSYGDKPESFLRICPNGLLPAIKIDGESGVQTESVPIMMTLDRMFSGDVHKPMWPLGRKDQDRAQKLMNLERTLFSDWCGLVFRGGGQNPDASRKRFEQTMDVVNRELGETSSPWFLDDLSIVDLQFVTHIERMAASCVFWSGLQIRGVSRWGAIERWLQAFEAMPTYMATKSDYYTHVQDIPPQYGPGFSQKGSEAFAKSILGEDGSWALPLKPLSECCEGREFAVPLGGGSGGWEKDVEESARQEAAYKLIINHENIVKFACRGPGQPGRKQFQAPLADPYATPNLDYASDVDCALKIVCQALVGGEGSWENLQKDGWGEWRVAAEKKRGTQQALVYLRDRIGVPRDMSYPAARQLRAHLNWILELL